MIPWISYSFIISQINQAWPKDMIRTVHPRKSSGRRQRIQDLIFRSTVSMNDNKKTKYALNSKQRGYFWVKVRTKGTIPKKRAGRESPIYANTRLKSSLCIPRQ